MNAPHEAHIVFESPQTITKTGFQLVLRHNVNDNYNIGRLAIDSSTTEPKPIHQETLRIAAATPEKERSQTQKKLLETEFANNDTRLKQAERRVASAKKALGLGKAAAAMVYRDRSQRRATYIHERGDFLRKDMETGPLSPNVPSALPELNTDSKIPSRLDLADWLVDKRNPLTARVTVNRVWMRYFGRGLVERWVVVEARA